MRNDTIISFQQAVDLIQKGEVVAIPTETVYGLAGSVENEFALKKIFQIKKRPAFNPLIIHCCDQKMMKEFHTEEHPLLNKMIKHFCPGPITFILNKTKKVHSMITAGQTKVGLRIPKHPFTLKLIKKTGQALCAPSANLYGTLSPTCVEHVYKNFKDLLPILDGGPCTIGIESTVLEPNFKNKHLSILRPGGISKKDLIHWLRIEKLTDWTVDNKTSSLSPGQSYQHYQPSVPLVILETKKQTISSEIIDEHLQSLFSSSDQKIFKNLKLKKSAVLSARSLYEQMHTLSQNPSHVLYTIKTLKNSTEDWEAIWNRLYKASSFKINI